ncbi:Rha family transcriptional regulator [Planococcus sp. A6]|uniref:Rha family transcriptional regulator n=1 Tax=Planococcus sp. A6 TaxID=2992760 RepID=UPI00237BA993|nr:Rha family transcriptional regulator [Planococcus sp. A6]MDE0581517.1 Rha family transcriptional regulator [Planococcus sp. A6]
MNNLKVVSKDGQLVTDSRDVAAMTGKEHKELMRSIRQYSSILTGAKLRSLDFFVPHYYEDAKKEQRPCFLLTKKGCDMVANKMTGERGVLFTAEYVTRFEKMEKSMQQPKLLSESEQLRASLKLTLEAHDQIGLVKQEIAEVRDIAENQVTLDYGEQRRLQKAVAIKVYELETDPIDKRKLFSELYREIKDRFAVASYKDIKRKDLQIAIRYIDGWLPRKVS